MDILVTEVAIQRNIKSELNNEIAKWCREGWTFKQVVTLEKMGILLVIFERK